MKVHDLYGKRFASPRVPEMESHKPLVSPREKDSEAESASKATSSASPLPPFCLRLMPVGEFKSDRVKDRGYFRNIGLTCCVQGDPRHGENLGDYINVTWDWTRWSREWKRERERVRGRKLIWFFTRSADNANCCCYSTRRYAKEINPHRNSVF